MVTNRLTHNMISISSPTHGLGLITLHRFYVDAEGEEQQSLRIFNMKLVANVLCESLSVSSDCFDCRCHPPLHSHAVHVFWFM